MPKIMVGYLNVRSYNWNSIAVGIVKHCFILIFLFFLLFTSTSTIWAISYYSLLKSNSGVKLSLVGPKKYYLALGDSEAFGFQPDTDFDHGYADDFFKNLKNHGVASMANLGCNGETSSTFVKHGCLFPFLRKHAYIGSQLTAAIKYLKQHPGQVSPVTLDIGANDLVLDIDTKTCTVSSSFETDLKALDINLTQIILPQLHAALTVNGQVTGDLLMMNYYDPYQNKCPNTLPYIQILNQHLAIDISESGTIVDVFSAFGGVDVPNNHICTYTWMCSIFKDYHPTDQGYSIIANAFEKVTGY